MSISVWNDIIKKENLHNDSLNLKNKRNVTSNSCPQPKLEKEIKTSVAIIGAGITGVLIAHSLKAKGVDCILIEANKVGMGVTQNTTAKITSQHNLLYDRLIKEVGREKAQQYLYANEFAIKKYRELCKNIDCDFQDAPAFVYSTNDRAKIENEVSAVKKLGFDAEFVSNLNLPFNVVGAIQFKNQAQFNPLKFINTIAKDLIIYENTMVKKIENNIITTESGKVIAEKVVIATHFPFINTHGSYFVKLYQQRSYVLALEGASNLGGMYIDEKENGLSFRNYKNLLLFGGCGHRTGHPGGGYKALRELSSKIYPNAHESYFWATQDCMSLDKIPYIGRYSANTPNLFVATGFNKWGMTSSMVSSEILSDMILGKKNEYQDVFSPQRSIIKKQFFINGFEATKNLLTPSTKRCSHLGCALKYNKQENSWDCPCHGSRFEKNGDLINNPAMKGINID